MGLYDTMSLIGSLILIVLILVATYYATRWYGRRMQGSFGRHIKVLERTPLGQHAALAIVKVDGKYYLLAISEKNVQMLCELEDFDESESGNSPGQDIPVPKAFQELFNKAKERIGTQKKDDGGR